jgi:replication initiation and membrane attachment protein DnaB
VHLKSRGKELPGTYNHVLLAELFREQASLWEEMALDHVEDVGEAIATFVDTALKHAISDEYVLEEIQNMIHVQLQQNIADARGELQRLWEDEQHQPITYNHYFTDNVQKAREQGTRTLLKQAMTHTREHDWNGKMHISNTQVDLDKFLAGLQQRIIVNMDEQACNEALTGLNAYYKVN